ADGRAGVDQLQILLRLFVPPCERSDVHLPLLLRRGASAARASSVLGGRGDGRDLRLFRAADAAAGAGGAVRGAKAIAVVILGGGGCGFADALVGGLPGGRIDSGSFPA